MSSLLPLASYNLELEPYSPEPAQSEDFPVTIRLTLAAIDPEAVDDDKIPSTLRILKATSFDDEFDDDLSEDDEFDEEASVEGEDEDEEEEDEEEEEEAKEGEDAEEESDFSDDEDDVEEHVICTLSPSTQFQQTIDLTILPDERVFFVVTGSYKIHLTGNYVEHPYDEEDDFSDSEDDDESDSDYDLTPDEDEIIDGEDFDLDQLDEIDDIEGKIEELVEQDNNNKKRAAEVEEVVAEVKPTKKAKKDAKKETTTKEKGVKFNKELEQGPTTSTKKEKEAPKAAEPKKFTTKTLPGGVVIEDRTTGTGPVAKKGQKVGVRYIGKLKNGKVFDKNTSGKPFNFGLGKGEVIKGWDVGVAGMAVGGERRIVIPAPMAYGSKKLPGIPANSELTFDVKLLSIK